MKIPHNYITHKFFCIKCKNEGIPIMRKIGYNQHEALHLKKLYCIHCKEEVNHVECRNQQEINIFKEKYDNGEYLHFYLDGLIMNKKINLQTKRR